jgi:GDP-4-dehydro-6-deoxy-D-mannose reductase
MRILITGATGFIGSHLTDYIVSTTDTTTTTIFGTVWKKSELVNVRHLKAFLKIIECDIRDKKSVENLIKTTMPDRIFHLAAQAYVLDAWRDPIGTMETNVCGTINLFEAIKKFKCEPIIVVSCSSAEYGASPNPPFTEEHPLLPINPYGVSKAAQDLLCYQYFVNFNLKIVRTRIFNTVGTRKCRDVCADFAEQIPKIEAGVQKVLSVGNLETKRDITDVRDTVRALWLLSEKGVYGDVYNICRGHAYKIKYLLDYFLKLSKKRIKVVIDKSKLRSSDEPLIVGDNRKIVHQTGWQPQIPIEKTLQDILDYWRSVHIHLRKKST